MNVHGGEWVGGKTRRKQRGKRRTANGGRPMANNVEYRQARRRGGREGGGRKDGGWDGG